jgi:hypothetical protein
MFFETPFPKKITLKIIFKLKKCSKVFFIRIKMKFPEEEKKHGEGREFNFIRKTHYF